MTTLAERLTLAIEHAQITKAELARRVGISAPSVNGWFSGKAKFLRGENLLAAAKALGVSEAWLATGKGPMYSGVQEPPVSYVAEIETPPGYVRFDLFEGGAGMGAGMVNQDYPEVVKTIEVAEWEVRRKLGYLPKPGRIQIITGRGPSMKPKLEDGDIVWIDTSCDYFDGDDYYLINIGGETQIKMLQKRGDGLYVVSVNTDFPAYRPDPGDVSILGKALIHAGLRKF
ncbi:LexA family transcriptional regulator [Stenotrophomonas maltophilia]|uniref:Helix-turn-helix transcriptional regulator n=1 Tax=Stenotrophomonas maltophilia TaxID=40324 RepID=A0ABD7C8C9_STEMA|nr:S24 family peptidase [Stenotrophomonas maltophilia]QQQ44119.1 helix-turn-helix transcriptional regulator [Stenotrophomonas maltophilia]